MAGLLLLTMNSQAEPRSAMPISHALFPTAFGTCGIAWSESGVTAFQLPEQSEALTGKRLAARIRSDSAADPPDWVQRIIVRVQKHLAGEAQDFSDTMFDYSVVSDFQRTVYRHALTVKSGQKCSYGDIATALALPSGAGRAVGVALATNPWPLLVPCHRVVSASGKMTGFSGPGGVRTKTRLLTLERAELLSE